MYFLKKSDNTRLRFERLKDVFEYLEIEYRYYFYVKRVTNLCYNYSYLNVLSLVGDEFLSKKSLSTSQFMDMRNRNAYLYGEFSVTQNTDLKLVTKNRYILLDHQGRVVPVSDIKKRYKQRAEKKWRKASSRNNHRPNYKGVESGFCRQKRFKTLQRSKCKPSLFCRRERNILTSEDVHDKLHPIRARRRVTIKSLCVPYDEYYRHVDRCWKNKKSSRKQWQ